MLDLDFSEVYLDEGQREFKRGKWQVRVKSYLDTDPDLSWMGTYAMEPEDEYSIKRVPNRNNDFAYFIPQPGGMKASEYAEKYDDALEHMRQDFERMEGYYNDSWSMLGIEVTIYLKGIELGSASLWGIESDSGEYMDEIIEELTHEAIGYAENALKELCDG